MRLGCNLTSEEGGNTRNRVHVVRLIARSLRYSGEFRQLFGPGICMRRTRVRWGALRGKLEEGFGHMYVCIYDIYIFSTVRRAFDLQLRR